MAHFIARRGVRGLIALLVFQTGLFILMQALPYDISTFLAVSPADRTLLQHIFGLNQPLWKQYLLWMKGFFSFDLGRSFLAWPMPVSEILLERAPRTLVLFLTALVLAYLLGMWLGKTIAWRRGGLLEGGVTLFGVASYTSFAPFLAFVLINVFARTLRWLPYQRLADPMVWLSAPVTINWVLARLVVTGLVILLLVAVLVRATRSVKNHALRLIYRIFGSLLVLAAAVWGWHFSGYAHLARDALVHMTLPLGSVILLSFGETMLLMRTSMLEYIGDDHVLMARAKGLPEHVIRDRHVARNAFFPVLTRLLLNLPLVLTGSLAIELVFRWQAMGQLIFLAIDYQDIPLLLGILSFVGVLTLIGHVVLDIAYIFLDPRLRYVEAM